MSLSERALAYHEAVPAGKLSVAATKPCNTSEELSLAYSPGVAAPCLAIRDDADAVYRYTGRSNLVAVITNGTAVLGLGNIGPSAAKPVMEGKALLFKRFADIDAFDIELAATEPEDVIAACSMLEPTFGGINLEDIRAPECFTIEQALRKRLGIPVFHDDQHGTAVIVAAALLNACEVVEKALADVRVVINGAGASAMACADHLIRLGVTPDHLLMCDSKGVLALGRDADMSVHKKRFARPTSARTVDDALLDADVLLGLSAAGSVHAAALKRMAPSPIVFVLANPEPEIPVVDIRAVRPDAIIATGRSDYPNQVNNLLGFPGIFRGTLDTRATTINDEMLLAATAAIASLARTPDAHRGSRRLGFPVNQFGRQFLIPSAFDNRVVPAVAMAVATASLATGVARTFPDLSCYQAGVAQRVRRSERSSSFAESLARRDDSHRRWNSSSQCEQG